MSDTPRTDKVSMITLDAPDGVEVVYADDCRKIERELAEARELLGMLQIRGNELYNDNWQYERDYLNEVKDFLERTEK